MPRKSKIKLNKQIIPKGTKPGQAPPVEPERTEFYCCRCTRHFKKQKGNFPASQSSIYEGNGKYLTICNHCVDELFEHYKAALQDEKEAIKRICLKFDIYWNREIYDMLYKANTSQSRVRAYISKTNLYKYVGKTFDDTLDEEYQAVPVVIEEADIAESSNKGDDDNIIVKEEIEVSEDVVRYWGTGMPPETYIELENRRAYWMSQFSEDTVLTPGEEALLRQICILETSINKDLAAGNSIERSTSALNTLLGSMNIKPSQKKASEEAAIPFGCEIAKFEEEEPIIEPDKSFEDVDGIRKNVLSWFLGSLCKTAGIKNRYSKYFEEEIEKYTVERPEYSEDDEEDAENIKPPDGGEPDG